MDVTGVPSGAAGPDGPLPARGAQMPSAAQPAAALPGGAVSGDSVSGFFRQLSSPDLSTLLEVVEKAIPRLPEAQTQALLQAAVTALAERQPDAALGHVRELLTLDPQRSDSVTSEPGLAEIRSQIEQLVRNLTSTAKLHAEGRLAEASRVLPESISTPEALSLPVLIAAATQLIKTGGLPNYVQSARISEQVIEQGLWAPVNQSEHSPAAPRVAAPYPALKALIAAWLLVGAAAAGTGWVLHWDSQAAILQVWAAGFVALALYAVWRIS